MEKNLSLDKELMCTLKICSLCECFFLLPLCSSKSLYNSVKTLICAGDNANLYGFKKILQDVCKNSK